MKAIILAAGYATRLYPLTENQPKPLLPIAGKPLLEHIIDKISPLPIDEIIIVSNNKFYNHFQKWRETFQSDLSLTILNDGSNSNETRLGSIKDLLFALEDQDLNQEFLVLAGDNLLQFNFQDFYNQFKSKGQTTIAVYNIQDIEKVRNKHGVAIINPEQKVIDFQEKPSEPKSTLKSIACYLFKPSIQPLLKQYLESNNPDAPGYFIQWLIHQTPVYAHQFTEPVYDIGTLESYQEVQRLFENIRKTMGHRTLNSAVCDSPSFLGDWMKNHSKKRLCKILKNPKISNNLKTLNKN